MKRIGILLTMVLTATVLFAQPAGNKNMAGNRMKRYIQQNVVPFLQQERTKLISVLNEREKTTLTSLQDEMNTFREQGKQIRESMKGNYNAQLAKMRKDAFDSIVHRAEALTNNHPRAVAGYKKNLVNEKKRWEKDLHRLFPKMTQNHPGFMNNPMMKRLDNSAYLLLWDGTTIPWHRMNKTAQKVRRNGMHRQMPDKAARQKLTGYVKQNIAPVVLAEQKAFVSNLSAKEKKEIEAARALVKQRKEMFMKYAFQGDTVEKPAVNDSVLLARRVEMQKAMLPVNEIALKHYNELEPHLQKLKAQMPKWRKEIAALMGRDTLRGSRNPAVSPVMRRLRRMNTPAAFLLFSEDFFEK